jgi:cAMP-dependent protein kinase regulator
MNTIYYEPETSFEKRVSVAMQFGKQHGNKMNAAMRKDLMDLSKYVDLSETSFENDCDPIEVGNVPINNDRNITKTEMTNKTKQGSVDFQLTSSIPHCDDVGKQSTRRVSQYCVNVGCSSGSGRFHNSPTRGINIDAPQPIFRQPKNVYEKESIKYDDVDFKVPIYYHNEDEETTLTKSLTINFMFRSLNKSELQSLVSAFEPCQFNEDDIIIQQGDSGDYFYVLHEGKVNFLVDNIQIGTTSEKGSSFGELALLYSSPRAATVIAAAKRTTLFRVDKRSFRHILRNQTISSTETKKQLLHDIAFLKDLGDTNIRKLMRHMTPVFFCPGDVAAQKGTIGDKFFIIQEGEFVCTDVSVGNKNFEDLHLGPGDYFG